MRGINRPALPAATRPPPIRRGGLAILALTLAAAALCSHARCASFRQPLQWEDQSRQALHKRIPFPLRKSSGHAVKKSSKEVVIPPAALGIWI